ncbi:MAG: hypothetical protein ACTSVG_07835 [Alphaproteobacteria bacterium]
MRRSYSRTALGLAQAAAVMLFVGAAAADHSSGYQTADGLTIYYAVVPAEILRAYPNGSPEAIAHQNIPRGKNVEHLLVAVFEGKSMARVTDARIAVRVRETGLGWSRKPLEPRAFAGALTYCNFFTFYNHATYTIVIEVRRPGASAAVTTEFEYKRH